MPEILELPPTAFTQDTGREAGLRSAELRAQQAKELERLRLILVDKPIEPEPKPVNQEVNRQIELTNEQIECVREELKRLKADEYGYCSECKRHGADGKELAALIREMRGLMEHLCRLHAIPAAPTTKVTPKPHNTRRELPPPTISQAQPGSPEPPPEPSKAS